MDDADDMCQIYQDKKGTYYYLFLETYAIILVIGISEKCVMC